MTTASSSGDVMGAIRSLRLVALAVAASTVVFGILAYFMLPDHSYPPVWVPLGLGALLLVAVALCETSGFRPSVLNRRTPEQNAVQSLMGTTLVRTMYCELVFFVAVVGGFSIEPQTTWTVWIGVVLALAGLAYEAYPTRRNLRRLQTNLDRAGVRIDLLGDDGGASPIQFT